MDELDSPSRKKVLRNRRYVASHRLRQKIGGVSAVSEAVLADPTEAWRTKPSGKVNNNPERARQRAGADLAAALPKNVTLHGPALAVFLNHPKGKRAAAAMHVEVPQDAKARMDAKRLDALSSLANAILALP